jgi:hypothetical protein
MQRDAWEEKETGERKKSATHDKIADENLQDLGAQALAAGERLLQQANQNMAQRRADEGAVDGHLGHAPRQVVAVWAAVVRQPRRQHLLQRRQRSRCQHLRAQRVRLQLRHVCLYRKT